MGWGIDSVGDCRCSTSFGSDHPLRSPPSAQFCPVPILRPSTSTAGLPLALLRHPAPSTSSTTSTGLCQIGLLNTARGRALGQWQSTNLAWSFNRQHLQISWERNPSELQQASASPCRKDWWTTALTQNKATLYALKWREPHLCAYDCTVDYFCQ